MQSGIGTQRLIRLFFDGASRGNPGHGGAGIAVFDNVGQEIASHTQYLGNQITNNQAEYLALYLGLQLIRNVPHDRLEIFSDSKLVVEQIKGNYRVRNETLKFIRGACMQELATQGPYTINHILRHLNTRADQLAKFASEQHG